MRFWTGDGTARVCMGECVVERVSVLNVCSGRAGARCEVKSCAEIGTQKLVLGFLGHLRRVFCKDTRCEHA